MAASLNKVMIIGNLGNDPDIRSMQSGDEVCNLSIATSDGWTDKSTGERKERTQWHKVVIFNSGLVKVAKSYLKKGSKVYIEGQIETRKWTDKDGRDQYTTEIVLRPFRGEIIMLDGRSGHSSEDSTDSYQAPTTSHDDMADDIPFAFIIGFLATGLTVLSAVSGAI